MFSNVGRRMQWHPAPVLLPGKSHGWRSLVGCSPWGREESHMTERLHMHFSLLCLGEGNGNPLQCSGLENSMDRWPWATKQRMLCVYMYFISHICLPICETDKVRFKSCTLFLFAFLNKKKMIWPYDSKYIHN